MVEISIDFTALAEDNIGEHENHRIREILKIHHINRGFCFEQSFSSKPVTSSCFTLMKRNSIITVIRQLIDSQLICLKFTVKVKYSEVYKVSTTLN